MTAVKLTKAQHLERAAWAHTNLTMFHAVIALLESGSIYGGTPATARARIIRICKEETDRQLRLYDEHSASALQEASRAD